MSMKSEEKGAEAKATEKPKRGYKVAKGASVVGLRAIIASDEPITAADVNGGEASIERLVAKGVVVRG